MMSAIKKSNIQKRIPLPADLSIGQVKLIADKVLQQNRENARNGLDATGKPFPNYTKHYKESLDFKNAGKTSQVTLTATGDMLAELSLLDYGLGYIIIGYSMDSAEAPKAHGNVTGEYGQESTTGKNRPFIGIPPNQLQRIITEVRSDTLSNLSADQIKTKVSVTSILSRFGLGGF